MPNERQKKATEFEKLAADIQASLSPSAIVKHNDKILGKDSKTLRQIDISVRQIIGATEILIAIECKDYKKPLDVGDVTKIYSDHQDIGANQSVIISANGYSKAASAYGKSKGMDLLLIADTGDHAWKRKIHAPILLKLKRISSFNLSLSTRSPFAMKISYDPKGLAKLIIYNAQHESIGTIEELLFNYVELDSPNEGAYLVADFLPSDSFIYSCENYHAVKIESNLEVKEEFYLHYVLLSKVTGFIDALQDRLVCKGDIEFSVDVNEIVQDSNRIDKNKLQQEPSLVLTVFATPSLEEFTAESENKA